MTLVFLALLGAPYIYDISSLRVKVKNKDTNTHSGYLVLTGFARQQWLREGTCLTLY